MAVICCYESISDAVAGNPSVTSAGSHLSPQSFGGGMWRPLAAIALVCLAGCTGLFGEQRTQQVTPAEVPTVSSSLVELPRANGSVDIDAVVAGHEAALANRSFARHVELAGPENLRDVWVDDEADIVRVRRSFGPLVDDAILSNGTVYRAVSEDPDIDYRAAPSNDTVPYVSSRSGSVRLDRLLLDGGYRRIDTVQRNGRPLAVLAVNATSRGEGVDPSIAVQSRLYVDSEGIIREVDHWERRSDGTVVSLRMTVQTDTGAVPIPWWAEDIGLYD